MSHLKTKLKHITRQKSKNCWRLEIRKKDYNIREYFFDTTYGGINKSLAACRLRRREIWCEYGLYNIKQRSVKKKGK